MKHINRQYDGATLHECWDPDNTSRAEAKGVWAEKLSEAAKEFAEHEHRSEPFEELRVHIALPDSDRVREFDVEAEQEVSFYVGMGSWVAATDAATDEAEALSNKEA